MSSMTFAVSNGVVSSESVTAYTLSAADDGNLIVFTSTSAKTLTLPNSLPKGFAVLVMRDSASGDLTWSAASGATTKNRPGHTKFAGHGSLVAFIVVSNTSGSNAYWVIQGDTA
jgi:hypothetical protein